jgi:hypothetical protein
VSSLVQLDAVARGSSYGSMILIAGTESLERTIMAKNNSFHALSDGSLPSVVLPHAPCRLFLPYSGLLGLHTMNTLPRITGKVSFDRCLVLGALENFRECNWPDPQPGAGIFLKPLQRRTWFIIGDFIEQVDDE